MGSKTQTTKGKTTLPAYLEQTYKGLINAGTAAARQPLRQYSGARVAGFTPMQQQAFQLTQNAQGMGIPYLNAASQALGNASQSVYPQLQQYNAQNLQQYQDPFQQQVIDTTLGNILKSNAVAQQGLKGSGLGAGVSPTLGDRMGLAQAELERNQAMARNQTIAGLESSGFQNAQNQFLGQQQLQAGTMGQDLGRQLQVAQGFGQEGQQAQDQAYQGIAQLLQQGGQQQQVGQMQLDQAYNAWQERQNYPKDQIAWLANLAYGSPHGQTTTTTQPGPSILSQIAGAAATGLGIYKEATAPVKRGGAIHMDSGGIVPPQLDQSRFSYSGDFGFTPPPSEPGIHQDPSEQAGGMYINTLPQLNPVAMMRQGPYKGPWVTQLPANGVAQSLAQIPHFSLAPKSLDAGASGAGTPGVWHPPGWKPPIKAPAPSTPRGVSSTSPVVPIRHYSASRGGVAGLGEHMASGGDPWKSPYFDSPEGGGIDITDEAQPPVAAASVAPGVSGPPVTPAVAAARSAAPRRDWGMPLIYAGLGMMSSNSPYPLQAIGEGALKGLQMASELDKNPVVDDSGPTIRIYYPSERRWEDTGIPSTPYQEFQLKRDLMSGGAQPMNDTELQQYGITPEMILKNGRPYWDVTPTGRVPKFPGPAGGQTISLFDPNKAQTEFATQMASKSTESISKIYDQGTAAEGILPDIEALQALTVAAPKSVAGRILAEKFPQFNSVSAAYLGIAQDLAAKLHVAGVGSQSDREYAGVLQRVGTLSNDPKGNQILQQLMASKAKIEIAKKEAIDQYNENRADPNAEKIMRQKISQLNKQSIMTPQISKLISSIKPDAAPAAASDIKGAAARLRELSVGKTPEEIQVLLKQFDEASGQPGLGAKLLGTP